MKQFWGFAALSAYMQSHYYTLGLSTNASAAEIKAAFKKRALQYHPDKHGGDPAMEERFKAINAAYQVLAHPYEKAKYDLSLTYNTTINQPPPASPPHTYDPHRSHRSHRSQRPRPAHITLPIDWKENWIATAYAFGFISVVASIIMVALSIQSYYDQKAYTEKLKARRLTYERALLDRAHGRDQRAVHPTRPAPLL